MANKILLIDDEKSMVDLMKVRLERENYEIITASNGEDGLAKAAASKPDLIILDVVMPKMGGFAFVKQLRQTDALKDTPVIVLTGKAAMYESFREIGVADYLLKPFMPDELAEKVNQFFQDAPSSEDAPSSQDTPPS